MAAATSAIDIVGAIAESIRTAGSVPSGHLYAMLCGKVGLGAYQDAIGILKRAKLVEQRGHELTWIGPKIAAGAT